MSADKIKQYYREQAYEQHIHLYMALQCAPLLKGILPAGIVSVENRMLPVLFAELERTGLVGKRLHQGNTRTIIFLYNTMHLAACLRTKEVRSLLTRYGYCYMTRFERDCPAAVEALVGQLVLRMQEFYTGKGEFPHEIGCFLGYPPADVEAFVSNRGQGYKLSGYWKVYADVAYAQAVFRKCDHAREEAVEQVLAGRKFYEIVA